MVTTVSDVTAALTGDSDPRIARSRSKLLAAATELLVESGPRAVTVDAVPAMSAWQAAGICLVFFTGSVLHVKSLIRGAGDRRWAIASRVFHILALGLGLLSAWLLVPFGAAAVRSFVVPQGTRPAVVGAVETVISVLVVVATVAALR